MNSALEESWYYGTWMVFYGYVIACLSHTESIDSSLWSRLLNIVSWANNVIMFPVIMKSGRRWIFYYNLDNNVIRIRLEVLKIVKQCVTTLYKCQANFIFSASNPKYSTCVSYYRSFEHMSLIIPHWTVLGVSNCWTFHVKLLCITHGWSIIFYLNYPDACVSREINSSMIISWIYGHNGRLYSTRCMTIIPCFLQEIDVLHTSKMKYEKYVGPRYAQYIVWLYYGQNTEVWLYSVQVGLVG